MKVYYLHSGLEQQGPFDIEELKAKHITENTPVWFDGLPDWTNASEIDELKFLFPQKGPPPFNANKTTPPPVQNVQSTRAPTQQQPVIRKGHDGLIITIIILALVIVGGGFYLANRKSADLNSEPVVAEETYQEKVLTVKEIESSKPKRFLKAGGDYDRNIWGNKLKIHGILRNTATVTTYKDVIVRVIFYSKTKSELGKMDHKISEISAPRSETDFEMKIENYKDVDSIGWLVISALPE
jgi:hypothetical protein